MSSGCQKLLCLVFLLCSATGQIWGAVSSSFTNGNPIVINDNLTPPVKASIYPSGLTVTGLTGQALISATVTLQGLSHGFPSDVTMLLVSPAGQRAIIMSQAGGQTGPNVNVTNLTITLDDQATNSLPVYSRLNSGVFKPTNGYRTLGHSNLPYDLPPPAPPGNSNAPSPLSAFGGSDPNGVWNLYVVDDASGGAGIIANGWSLTLKTGIPLKINRVPAGVVLAWSALVSNAVLQSTTNTSAVWSNVPVIPVQVSGQWMVTNSIQPGARFFRLWIQ